MTAGMADKPLSAEELEAARGLSGPGRIVRVNLETTAKLVRLLHSCVAEIDRQADEIERLNSDTPALDDCRALLRGSRAELARLKAEVARQGRLLVNEGEKRLAAESDVVSLARKLAEREREDSALIGELVGALEESLLWIAGTSCDAGDCGEEHLNENGDHVDAFDEMARLNAVLSRARALAPKENDDGK